jgi:DNA polymerase
MHNDLPSVISDIRRFLEYYHALGFDSLPVSLKSAERDRYSSDEKADILRDFGSTVSTCTLCRLSKGRKNVVFGEGSPNAKLMFIGEAPGREEDIQGRPFVGEAGALLTRMIQKMGMERSGVYIANIIKCRPPMNRDPEIDEIETCGPYLEKQIAVIKPVVIMTLGRIALQALMKDPGLKITAARGNFLEYRNIPLMPTFHPAYLLRNPKDKWLTWNDVQKVMERIRIS